MDNDPTWSPTDDDWSGSGSTDDGWSGSDGNDTWYAPIGPDPADPDPVDVDPWAAGAPVDVDGSTHPAGADVVGDPETSAGFWHQQEQDTTCAVAVQEFILDETTGLDRTEAALVQLATEQGWYIPGGGTPMDAVGNLLEHHGVEVDQRSTATFDDLRFALADGAGVIVAVDSEEIWSPQTGDPLDGYPGIPGQGADHAVQVTGLDYRDPDNPMVILNDPGISDGAGTRVPMEVFWNAWGDSDRFMVRSAGGRGD